MKTHLRRRWSVKNCLDFRPLERWLAGSGLVRCLAGISAATGACHWDCPGSGSGRVARLLSWTRCGRGSAAQLGLILAWFTNELCSSPVPAPVVAPRPVLGTALRPGAAGARSGRRQLGPEAAMWPGLCGRGYVGMTRNGLCLLSRF